MEPTRKPNEAPYCLCDLLADYLSRRGHTLADSSRYKRRRAFEVLIETMGDVRVAAFDPDLAEGYQAALSRRLGSRHSVNSYVKDVSPVFTWAVDRGLMKENPFAGMAPLRAPIDVNIFDAGQMERLIRAAPDLRWRGIVVAALSTGMRPTEILNTTFEDVLEDRIAVRAKRDVPGRTWRWAPKGLRPREAPIAAMLNAILCQLYAELPTDHLYPFLSIQRYRRLRERIGSLSWRIRTCPEGNWSRMCRQIKARAGIKKGKFYDTRKTCLSAWSNVLSPQDLAKVAGHRDVKTTMTYYLRASAESLARARNAAPIDCCARP